MKILILLVVCWFFGDFCYSRYVVYRVQQWESQVPWTSDGLAPDAREQQWGPKDASIAILMIHGFSDSPQIWRKIGPEIGKEGLYVRAILLPGFGRDMQAYRASKTESWLEKVNQEVASLRNMHDEVWVVAHSLGGAITIQHTLRASEGGAANVDGIALIAPAVAVSNERSPLLPTRFWHEASKFILPFSTTTCSPFNLDVRDPEERERPFRNTFSPRTIVDCTFRLLDQNRHRAAEIEIPSLIFLATTDKIVSSPAIKTYWDKLGSQRKKLVSLDNSGHMVPVDLEWRSVTTHIIKFVNQTPRATPNSTDTSAPTESPAKVSDLRAAKETHTRNNSIIDEPGRF